MCELLGVSSAAPARFRKLLREFGRHGGEIADNPDGWGIGFLDAGRLVVEKAPEPAARSARFGTLAESLRSGLVLAHVRKANPRTTRTLANTHPFVRDCCGRSWMFAHNGKVTTLLQPDGCCHPRVSALDGDTDSERAFCFLLEQLVLIFHEGDAQREAWLREVAALSGLIASHGRFNFLLSDGALLIAYGHDRLHVRAEGINGSSRAVVSTEPLGKGAWEPFRPGELRVFHAGRELLRVT